MGNFSAPLAIVGISCRLPGANNLDEYWRLIRSAGDASCEIPHELLDRDLYYDPQRGKLGKSYTERGALVDSLPFDNSKCRLPEEELQNYDESHLTLCEVASDAFRHANYDPFSLPSKNVGVYLGHTGGTNKAGDVAYAIYIEQAARYLHQLESLGRLSTQQRDTLVSQLVDQVRREFDHRNETPELLLSSNMAAQIIAKAFTLEGPCVVIDAACASSMQALAVAGRALQQGSIDVALVGGASVCKPASLILFSAAQSVSDSVSRPFDEEANGLIASEGYVTLVVKTLDAALAAGDTIHSVVRGIGMSADGKGKSLWAPLKDGQKLAIERAYESCRFSADDIQYLEAHATSTQVGDATEISALSDMFSQRSSAADRIAMGSVKANIGHTLETAGLAGLVKTILAMKHQTIPPCANLQNPNSNIPWEELPFYLPRTPQAWPTPAANETRKAAVNAFGIGGMNVHVVLEEFQATKESSLAPSRQPSSSAIESVSANATSAGSAMHDEPIAVVGMGMIVPGAESPEEFWNLLETGQDPKTEAPKERWNVDEYHRPGAYQPYRSYGSRGGFVVDYEYDWRAHKVPPKQVLNANPLQFALLDATDRALKSAGYSNANLDANRVGVVVGTTFGGEFSSQLQVGMRLPEIHAFLRPKLSDLGLAAQEIELVLKEYSKLVLKEMPALIDETGSFTSSTLASRITKTFNFKGGALCLDGGMGTGLAALSACVDTLRSGDCDLMLCAVGDRNMDLTVFEGLASQNMLSANPQPDFDEQNDGIVPGEGCGTLVLKRLSDAERDGDKVWAVVRGVGAGADWNQSGRALQLAIQRSLELAHANPQDLCSIDVVGSLQKLEDATLAGINDIYAPLPLTKPLQVSSLVSQFGLMGANHAMAATIKACLATHHARLPAGITSSKPRSSLFPQTNVRPLQQTQLIEQSTSTGIGVLCGAHAGTAYHAIIDLAGRPTETLPTPTDTIATDRQDTMTESFIVRLGERSWEQLQQQLTSQSAEQLLSSFDHFRPTDKVRLAIVCGDRQEFHEKLQRALASWSTLVPESRNAWSQLGVFFGEPVADRCTTALLFPGHGSQYPGMFHDLIEHSTDARLAAKQAEAALALLDKNRLADIIGPNAQGLGTVLWNTQASMLLANWIADQTLKSQGLRAGVVAGHSFGEYAALASAGIWNITDALRAAKHRSLAIESLVGVEGGMAATSAPLEVVEQVLAAAPEGGYVANINSPGQIVISGSSQALQYAEAHLSQLGHGVVQLKVPSPFHTPLLAPAAADLTQRLQEIPMQTPLTTIYSTVGLGELTTRDEIIASLTSQLTQKVDFPTILSRVMQSRPALIVEVGPKQVLTKLVRKNYPQSEVVLMATDNPARPAELAFLDVRAQAECLDCLTANTLANNTSAVQPPVLVRKHPPEITTFDATERRRARLRNKSRGGSQSASAPAANGSSQMPATRVGTNNQHNAPANGNGNGHGNGSRASAAYTATPANLQVNGSEQPSNGNSRNLAKVAVPQTVAPTPTQSSKQQGATTMARSTPSVAPSASPVTEPVSISDSSVRLDEIRTVLVEFVVEQTGYPEDIIELDADLEADLGIDSIKKAQLFGEVGAHFSIAPQENLSLEDFPTLGHVMEFLAEQLGANDSENAVDQIVTAPAPVAAESVPPSPAPATVSASNSCVQLDEIRSVLVEFVVEQTGYPEDIIELDADLEADLGIDSIKKAQLFGEVGAHFSIAPQENLSLEDFPTLGHVMEFLAEQLGASDHGNAVDEIATAPAAAVADVLPSPTVPTATSVNVPNSNAQLDEIRTVLVEFVVEQTGYPEDIIELDADLEADLGIDSIKKAQLFGEVGAHFSIAPQENLSLEDFPTLGHVMEFLAEQLGADSSGNVEPKNNGHQAVTVLDNHVPPAASIKPPIAEPFSTGTSSGDPTILIETLYGTAEQRGKRYGEALQSEIREFLAMQVDAWQEPQEAGAASWPCALNDALAASATGAGVNTESVMAVNRQLAPLEKWPISFLPSQTNAASYPHGAMKTVAQIHHEMGNLSYLSVNLVGQLHVRAAVNSAGLAISCEPLSERVLAEDIIVITGRLHQILSKASTVATACEQLTEAELQGRWCVGLNEANSASPTYLVLEKGQAPTESVQEASPQQRAFHDQLQANPTQLVISSRKSSQQTAIDFSEHFNEAPKSLPAQADTPEVMSRYVLRTTPALLPPANVRAACDGQTFFLLGNNEVAECLRQSIVDCGGIVEVFADAESLSQRLATEAPAHLVLLPYATSQSRRLQDGFATDLFADIFQVCQQWIAALERQKPSVRPSLSMITRMSGDFGFQQSVVDFAGGGLSGLGKAIRREFPIIRVKVLDCDQATVAQTAADHLLEELSCDNEELEIAIHSGQRHVVQAIATPVAADEEIATGGVWVATGGGRGVTAVVARELASRYNLRMHLLGTSPAPDPQAVWRGMNADQLKEFKKQSAIEARQQGVSPADQWRKIEKAMELDKNFQQLTEAGVQWQYHCCDVSNYDSLRNTLENIRREQGPIEGILHAAGVEAACRFSRKQPELIWATIASKCDGAQHLIELTRQDPLRYFAAFGSTSGRFGGLGQADYSLASDLLAKITSKLACERPETKAVCFHWPAWGDAGMAMRPESRATLEASGVTYMPALEGTEHLIRELSSSENESEVLLLDQGGFLDTDGTMQRSSEPAVVQVRNGSDSPPTATKVSPSVPASTLTPSQKTTTMSAAIAVEGYPLVEQFSGNANSGEYQAICRFSPTADPFLLYHQFRDLPFLPGVISMEAMAEAAQLALPEKDFLGFSNVNFEKGMAFRTDAVVEATVLLKAHPQGMECQLVAPFVDSQGQVVEQQRVYSSALALFGTREPLTPIDPGTPLFGWSPFYYPREIMLSHGQPMQSLRQLDYNYSGGRGQIHASSPREVLGDRPTQNMMVASLSLDGALVCCGFFGFCMLEKQAGLPHSIQEFRQARLPGHYEHCTLRFFYKESNAIGETYDFVLLGDAGDTIFEIKGYQTASALEIN